MVSIATHRAPVAGSEACPLHLQADPKLTLVCHIFFLGFSPPPLSQQKQVIS